VYKQWTKILLLNAYNALKFY